MHLTATGNIFFNEKKKKSDTYYCLTVTDLIWKLSTEGESKEGVPSFLKEKLAVKQGGCFFERSSALIFYLHYSFSLLCWFGGVKLLRLIMCRTPKGVFVHEPFPGEKGRILVPGFLVWCWQWRLNWSNGEPSYIPVVRLWLAHLGTFVQTPLRKHWALRPQVHSGAMYTVLPLWLSPTAPLVCLFFCPWCGPLARRRWLHVRLWLDPRTTFGDVNHA